MYDLLTIWDVDNSRPEMEQLGLRILLAFAAQPDIVVRRSRKGGGRSERVAVDKVDLDRRLMLHSCLYMYMYL